MQYAYLAASSWAVGDEIELTILDLGNADGERGDVVDVELKGVGASLLHHGDVAQS